MMNRIAPGSGGMLARAALLLALGTALAGCSVVDYVKGIGGSDEDGEEKAELEPAPLADFSAEVELRKVWSAGVGNGQGKKFNRLHPALDGDAIFAAAADGTVAAFDAASGERRWKTDVDTDVSGGVGVGGDLVLVGDTGGNVIALESASGRELWRARLSGEVLAPPAADWDVVVVQTLDGKISGLDARTGARRWTHDTSMPLLTLRGTAPPLLSEGVAYAALASGRIVAIKADVGTVLWEARIATPQGQSEIERAVDIDGRPALVGQGIFAVSYQGKVGGLSLANGRPVWARDASSFVGVGAGFGNVYVAETSGTVSAYEVAGGALRWQNEQLARRSPGTPVAVGSYVAVADFDGYVHLLSQVDGHVAGRGRADSSGVRADLLASGDLLYVYDNDGGLKAFRVGTR
ncbi:MAG: Outer membrane protein assembly factor BamB [Pseudomonadales bacterium]|nr:Outer membrane protein assembly factor BamB [Pseudomonadales bacterium]